MSDKKILSRISKLMNQAENTDIPEEAETFREMAMKMASRHSISKEMLREETRNRDQNRDNVVSRSIFIEQRGARSLAIVALYFDAAVASGMYVIYNPSEQDGKKGYVVELYGTKFSVDFIESLCQRLTIDMEWQANEWVKKGDWRGRTYKGEPLTAGQVRNTFRKGYRKRIAERLEAIREEAGHEYDEEHGLASGTSALVLRNREQETREMWSEQTAEYDISRTDDPNPTPMYDQRANRGGRNAGKNARLFSDPEIGPGKKQIGKK